MAINGRAWEASIPSNFGAYKLRVNVAEDIFPAENRSRVYWSAEIIETSPSSAFNNNLSSWGIRLNGAQSWGGNLTYNWSNYNSIYLGDGNYDYYHNADGTLSISVEGSFQGAGGSPLGYTDIGNQTYVLTDFDRKPDAPTTVSITLNSDKSIFVQSNAVSSPAGTATYYIAFRESSDFGSTWGSWSSWTTIPGNARSYTYAAGTLTYGKTYQFMMYATNIDGASAATVSNSPSTVFLPSGGRRFDGSNFNPTTIARRFDGTNWNTLTIAKRFNGTSWVDLA